LQDKLYLGNLNARRDWGYAKEYVVAMWQMLQVEEPGDFVIATGQSHSIEDWLAAAFGHLGLSWHEHVVVDERYFRPVDVRELRGDTTKAFAKLGWEADTSMGGLCKLMVEADMRLAAREKTLTTVAA
jgi:GDPmannose 4,6-dehydratase